MPGGVSLAQLDSFRDGGGAGLNRGTTALVWKLRDECGKLLRWCRFTPTKLATNE